MAAGTVAVAAAVAGFALFGSGGGPVSDPIAQAATLSSNAPGYRLSLAMSISGSTLTQPITAYGNAIVDLRDRTESMSFEMDFSGEPQVAQVLGSTKLEMAIIQDHGTVYMKLPAALMQEVPGLGSKPWLKMDLSKATGVLSSDPTVTDPSRMLAYLRANSSSITNDGYQQIDGVETTHYHAMLNLSALAANVPAADQAQVHQALSALEQATGSVGVPIDVWVDAQHLVRRMSMSLSMHSSSGASVQEDLVADMSDYGPQPPPKLPPDDQVQDMTNLVHIGA